MNKLKNIIIEEIDIVLNELFTKRSANLESIIDNDNIPTQEEIFKSEDFQKNIINDLINNKRNVSEWELIQNSGSINNIDDSENKFNVDYIFNFKYNYNGVKIPLSLQIYGDVYVNWDGRYRPATRYEPAEYPEPNVDHKSLGRELYIELYDDDGNQIKFELPNGKKWITPELESKVAKSIMFPYL